MSQIPNCTDCKFFLQGKPGVPSVCRRNPPIMGMDQKLQSWITSFPILGAPKEIWCGEYKSKLVMPGLGDPH